MGPFTLVVAESREVAERLLAGLVERGGPPPVVALDESGWFLRLRGFARQRHVAIVVDSLSRPGTMLSALRATADAEQVTWVLPRRLVSPDALDAVAREYAKAGLAPVDVEPAAIGGDPATAVHLRVRAPAPDTWAAALSGVAGLSRPPADSTGCAARVGVVGRSAARWFGGWARTIGLRPEWRGSLERMCDGELDLLLIAACPEGFAPEDVAALAKEARQVGAYVVGVRDGSGAGPPAWEGTVDLELVGDHRIAGDGRLLAVPPVDLRTHNPRGFAPATQAAFATAGPLDDDTTSRFGEVRLVAEAEPSAVRAFPAVIDAAGLHDDVWGRAARLVELAASGVPVLLADDGGPPLRRLLGDELAAALAAATPAAVRDPHTRERLSVDARRAALRGHSMAVRWRQLWATLGGPPRRRRCVSVVLVTNREDFLDHAVVQLNRQRYEPRETVVVLHGGAFADGVEERLRSAVLGPVQIRRVDGSWRLGDALNAGVDAASGDLVAKMDDDDWYGPEHLTDLVLALEYSGAHLVGRAAEFVYLADLDVTIRRFVSEAEQPSRKIAGGTLLVAKADLDAVGGWRRVPRRVDTRLIDDVLAAGGQVYRTHGLGFILNRHGRGHTWATGPDYFLQQSRWQRRGLALEDAAIVEP